MSRNLTGLVLLALALVAAAAAAPPPLRGYKTPREAADAARAISKLTAKERQDVFKAWKAENGRKYKDGSAEDKTKYAAFAANLDEVALWNTQPGVSFFKGIHPLSDMTFDQFRASMLMRNAKVTELQARDKAAPKLPLPAVTRRTGRKLQQVAVPNEWDWRSLGKVPAVRDQGGCGSCWAFAAISALESKAMIDGWATSAPNESEQQMVDCVNSARGYWSAGCNGGYSDEVFHYASGLFATTEAAYPYTGVGGTCKVSSSTAPPTGALKLSPSPGYTTVAASADAIMAAVSSTGPVVIYFNVQNSFYGYSSGVYPASACTSETINHAMVVVGYNKTAGVGSLDSYWIIRNSWGTWGDKGYVKVQMTKDTVGACAMYRWGRMLPLSTSSAAPPVCTNCTANQYCASGVCTACPTNCAACTGASTCTACKAGWKGATCSLPDCGSSCAANEFCTVVSGAPACAACNPKCATCSTATTCTACADGWTGAPSCSTPTCDNICAANQFCSIVDANTAACTDCPANCAACSDANTCSACLPGWKGTTCSQPDCGSSCAANEFCTVVDSAPACAACSPNCATCSGSADTCLICAAGWKGAPSCTTATCTLTSCPAGQFCSIADNAVVCTACPANCAACTGAGFCSACLPGWKGATCTVPDCGSSCARNQFCTVLNGAPACANCPTNCATCTSATSCTSCVYGFSGYQCGTACGKSGASCRSRSQCCSGRCRGKRCS